MTRYVWLCLCLVNATCAGDLTVRWGHQLVTTSQDTIFRSMVADGNDRLYLVISRKGLDASGVESKRFHLLKFTKDGEPLWDESLAEADTHLVVTGLAVDRQGGVYAHGYTESSLGRKNAGKNDAFFAKYDGAGVRQWVRQFGTGEHDVCDGLAIDESGNVYVTGYTYGSLAKLNQGSADIFVAVYDAQGALRWADQFGTDADDRAADLRLGDSNDLYLCGTTVGSLAGGSHGMGDLVVARYERTGKRLWVRQYGTEAQETGICMTVNERGQVFVGGITNGDFAHRRAQRGRGDAFVARVSETGELLWAKQFGSRFWDQTWDLAAFADGSGDVLAGGCQIPTGVCQGFCRRYSPQGTLVWVKEFRNKSVSGGTCGRSVAVDSDNNCYHAGSTKADLFAHGNGTGNVYLVRFDGLPNRPAGGSDTGR